MKPRSKIAATFAAGLACGLAVSLMLAAGRSDPTGEWTSAVTQHGGFIAVWKYDSFHGHTGLIEVVDANVTISEHLHAQAVAAEERFGPEHRRTMQARSVMDRFINQH